MCGWDQITIETLLPQEKIPADSFTISMKDLQCYKLENEDTPSIAISIIFKCYFKFLSTH